MLPLEIYLGIYADSSKINKFEPQVMYNENKVNKRVEQPMYLFENCCQVNSIRYQLDCTCVGESPLKLNDTEWIPPWRT